MSSASSTSASASALIKRYPECLLPMLHLSVPCIVKPKPALQQPPPRPLLISLDLAVSRRRGRACFLHLLRRTYGLRAPGYEVEPRGSCRSARLRLVQALGEDHQAGVWLWHEKFPSPLYSSVS